MIPFALTAAGVCGALAIADLVRRPGDPITAMRVPILGIWTAAWLVYGVNLTRMPQPDAHALWVLAVTCLGTLAMVPTFVAAPAPVRLTLAPGSPLRRLLVVLLVVALALIAWDCYFVSGLVSEHGWGAGMSQHRLDRSYKGGAWSVPGMEVLHAAVTASGAVGFACWMAARSRVGLVLTFTGGMAAFLSTGRWDVVAYIVWLFAIYGIVGPRGTALLVRQAVVYALLPVFFVAHGQLLGKIDLVTDLANSSAAERAGAAAMGVPVLESGGQGAAAGTAAPRLPADAIVRCERWERGVSASNEGFRGLSRVTKTIVLYFAGPMATLDRALCEHRYAERVVLAYWPNKLLRVAGLRAPEKLLVVDPFLDIGIPFNNYTAIYPFLSEVGPRLGLLAWLAFGVAIGRLWSVALRAGGLFGVVAGGAVLAMAIRTPWGNTFFDGTLLVWLAVALLPSLPAIVDRVARGLRGPAPAQAR